MPKDPHKNVYRALTQYSDDDKIIESLTARYLKSFIDPLLASSCLAFRCGTKGSPPPTIHTALRTISDFRSSAAGKKLYVAECDIQGFFDSVAHATALKTVRSLAKKATKLDKTLRVSTRALQILKAYLDSYSYPRNVLGHALSKLQKRDPSASFKWPKKELASLYKPMTLPKGIGVPQGGALSCLIANAVLNTADASLDKLKRSAGLNFLYLRYCDDMILIARSKRTCCEAFSTYRSAIKGLKLPIHRPKEVAPYQTTAGKKQFWQGKSRLPYSWEKPVCKRGIPWIQFVGYQIRYDGLVRVRLSSLRKQFKKLVTCADQLLSILNPGRKSPHEITAFSPGIRKTRRQILHRFRLKLISIAVGRKQLHHPPDDIMPTCWASGFSGMKEYSIIGAHLKALDRRRDRQISRVKKRCLMMPKPIEKKDPEARKAYSYYGFPFSYWAQFLAHPPSTATLTEEDPGSH